jgi:hypothetical protein
LWRILGKIIPRNDPDFFLQAEPIKYWWLEIDADLVAQRETVLPTVMNRSAVTVSGKLGPFVGYCKNIPNRQRISKRSFAPLRMTQLFVKFRLSACPPVRLSACPPTAPSSFATP